MQPIVKMKEIRKLFPGVVALDHINFDLYPGEVHVLIGENGAGKSTLMKILSGAYSPTTGSIEINGTSTESLTPTESIRSGIGIIYQELSVIDQLSIGENIFLGRQPMKKVGFLSIIDEAAMHARASEYLKKVGLNINTRLPLYTLSLAQKQLVEIAKVLSQNARVIIMDEPTSSLNNEEVELLFRTIRLLKQEGVAIVYISHKIKELRAIGDRITILKDGRTIATKKVSEFTSDDEISSLMVGREMKSERYNTGSRIEEDVMLRLEDLSRRDGKTQGVSIELHPGEIIGFAGLVGAGRTELMEAIFGAAGSGVTGQVSLNGRPISNGSTYQAIRNDLGMITENRRATGFMNNFSIQENIAVPRSLKTARLGGILHGSAESESHLHRTEGGDPVRRQPAESHHRQVAGRRIPGADLR